MVLLQKWLAKGEEFGGVWVLVENIEAMKTGNAMLRILTVVAVMLGALPMVAVAQPAEKSTEEVIALARSYLGQETTLQGVQTLRIRGKYFNFIERREGAFIIYLKKPNMQRTEFDDGRVIRTTATDGLEAWQRIAQREENGGIVILGTEPLDGDALRRIKQNAWDSLYFYAKDPALTITNKGLTLKDGFQCYWLEYKFDEKNVVNRYFDVENGAIVASTSVGGITIRELGNHRFDGIRFPKQVDAYKDGRLVHRLAYQEVFVNEEFPDQIFEYPVIPSPDQIRTAPVAE